MQNYTFRNEYASDTTLFGTNTQVILHFSERIYQQIGSYMEPGRVGNLSDEEGELIVL